MQKVDALLRSLLRKHQATAEVGEPKAASRAITGSDPAAGKVAVIVLFTGDVADLRAAGLVTGSVQKHPSKPYSIATGLISMDQVSDLAAIPHVEQIEGPRTFRSELNDSVPEIGAKALHEQTPTAFKGQGVVIGVIDNGFDYRHETFRRPDGTTRVLALWDQGLPRTGAETAPTGFTEGVEYTQAQINAALLAANPFATVRSRDNALGHGTHVTGIAAGDGSKGGHCHGAFTYIGVAPEADLILVKLDSGDDPALGNSVHLLHAIKYIFEHPSAAGRPVVINISQGDYLGGHDGKTLVELDIDIQVLLHNGRAVVKSAGNAAGPEGHEGMPRSGNKNKHVRATVPLGNNVAVEMIAFPGDRSERYVDIWYPSGTRLDLVVEAPGAGAPSSPSIAPGAADPAWVANPAAASPTTVHIESETAANTTGDNRILVHLDPAGGRIPSGTWKLHLANPGAADVAFHAWIDRGDNGPEFHPASETAVAIRASDDSTISIPGTAEFVITVGAYPTKVSAGSPPADFSSRGPTRDGRQKPEIMAPGVAIVSAASNVLEKSCCDCCCDCCLDFYVDLSGTSMAAPHVTGVVALMFQKNPGLSIANIMTHLKATARAPGGSIVVPNNDWGHGKVDALAVLNAVPLPPAPAPNAMVQPLPAAGPGGAGARAPSSTSPAPLPPSAPLPGLARQAEPARPLRTARRALLQHEPAALARLRELAAQTSEGQLYAALISRHFSEVRGLINARHAVGLSWQRARGPMLLRYLLETMRFPKAGRPMELSGPGFHARVRRFFEVLMRHGSPALRKDIERYASALLDGVERPGWMLDASGNRPG